MLDKDGSKVDLYRKRHLMVAEFIDAWRLIPRLLVAGYTWLLVKVVIWYMDKEPYLLEGCDVATLGKECLVQAPSTQHAALVTAVVGIAAAIFGLYSNSGRKWSEGVKTWNGAKKPAPKPEQQILEE